MIDVMGRAIDATDSIKPLQTFAICSFIGMRRANGEECWHHAREVAATLREVTRDKKMYRVALLHDILSHPRGEFLLKESPLTEEERQMVCDMHALRGLHIDAKTEDLDRFVSVFTRDMRILLLRMAHRLNDLRHLSRFDPELQRKIARETLHMYVSFAGRLGFNKWRHEMEDICFAILYPDASEKLLRQFESTRALDERYLGLTGAHLKQLLKKNGVEAEIEYRIKTPYSTYCKMLLKKRDFDELTDRLALRIITRKTADCYRALGIVHTAMHPIPGKLKDYIGAPKENGYQSIHTVVYPMPGMSELPMEIQFRTHAMHRHCEYGFLAHSIYKNALRDGLPRVDLIRNLEILREESRTPEEFEQAMKTYFNKGRLIIFDELNNLYYLKRPASVMDFVYFVHKEKSTRIKMCKVNGRVETFGRLLNDGDIVEVLFARNRTLDSERIKACMQKAAREELGIMIGTRQ